MLRALLEGQSSPQQTAELAKGVLRKKLQQLAWALEGRLEEHHRFLLGVQLDRIEQAEAAVAKVDERIEAKLAPYGEQHRRLMQIPGIDHTGAAVLIAELGVDMSVFPSAQHAAAWAGVAPGNNESAGKRTGPASRKGNIHLTTALVQAAVSASHQRGSFFREKYWRLKARRGPKRAALAIAHKILVTAYTLLARSADYADLGAHYLDRIAGATVKRNLVNRLERLGYDVALTPKQVPTA
jgi:transposase